MFGPSAAATIGLDDLQCATTSSRLPCSSANSTFGANRIPSATEPGKVDNARYWDVPALAGSFADWRRFGISQPVNMESSASVVNRGTQYIRATFVFSCFVTLLKA